MATKSNKDGFFRQFLRESTLHGVKYIGSRDRHPLEKSFWIVTVLVALGFSFYLVWDAVNKYLGNTVYISFQPKETMISQIPFPALTLCNVNILKTSLMQDIYELLKSEKAFYESTNYTEARRLAEAIIISEHMTHYCLAAPSLRRILNATIVDARGVADYVDEIQNIIKTEYNGVFEYYRNDSTLQHNTTTFNKMASHNCDDMILKCQWAGKLIPCENMFYRIYTQHGSCCTFNMMPNYILKEIPETDDLAQEEMERIPKKAQEAWKNFTVEDLIRKSEAAAAHVKYPKHQKAGGKPYGLSILINPELDVYSTCNTNDATGFKMVASSPINNPSIMDYGVAIPPSSEVFIDIEPQVTTASEEDLYYIDLKKRSCYFPNDRKAKLEYYKFYTASNCVNECVAKQTYKKCRCVRYFMPRNASMPLCGAAKFNCSEEVRKNLTASNRKDRCSQCKPACTEIQYKMQLSHFPLKPNTKVFRYNSSSGVEKVAENFSIVHVYLGTDSLYAKERKPLYDIFDVIANAGGLLSLTLGFSIISLVEVFYFFTLRAWFQHQEDETSDNDDDSRFYSKSTGNKIGVNKTAKPRIMDGLGISTKMTGYYNWAMNAAANPAHVTMVKSSQQCVEHEDYPVSYDKGVKRRIPAFQLLSQQNDDHEFSYPYLS